MNPYQRLKAWWFKPVEPDADVVPHDDVTDYTAEHFYEVAVDEVVDIIPASLTLPTQPKGRVIATQHSVYQAGQQRTGGRVVKIMPKQLKQMKEAQEKLGDD